MGIGYGRRARATRKLGLFSLLMAAALIAAACQQGDVGVESISVEDAEGIEVAGPAASSSGGESTSLQPQRADVVQPDQAAGASDAPSVPILSNAASAAQGEVEVQAHRTGRSSRPGTSQPPDRRRPGGGRPSPEPTPPPTTPPGPSPSPDPNPTPDPGPPTDPGAPANRVITGADQSSLANGFTVPAGQIWEFDSSQSVSIDVSRNVIVNGVLRMRPSNGSVVHRLRFVNVDETKYVGGGMAVLDSDVGIWVVGSGQLDLEGKQRTGWTTLASGVQQGATQLTLARTPVGWSVGDEITIAPTESSESRDYLQFDERTITSINGAVVGLSSPLSYNHPTVNGKWNAEVLNLTRNVQIEGTGQNTDSPTGNGRAHILVMSSSPQNVKYVQLRHLGPRVGARRGAEGVIGRYSLHFHHNGDGSRGSIVEGVVVRNSGNSAFVPHGSNGITIRDSVAYDGFEDAVWWDPPGDSVTGRSKFKDFGDDSHDILIDHVAVAGLRAPGPGGYQLSAFTMATGTNMTIRNSVAIAVEGATRTSGYHWPEQTNSNKVWVFENNMTHNTANHGLFGWQNSKDPHVISGYVAFHNRKSGINWGAYVNATQFFDVELFSNGEGAIVQHSGAHNDQLVKRPDGYTQVYENVQTNGPLVVQKQAVPSSRPVLYHNCSFTYVEVRNVGDGKGGKAGKLDFVNCNLQPSDIRMTRAFAGTEVRIQNGSEAFSVSSDGTVRSIAPFYAT